MKFYDISRVLANTLAPWPGDTPFTYKLVSKISPESSVNIGAITMSVHNGTHADAPFHFDGSGAAIDQMPLEPYLGPAVLVDLSTRLSETQRLIQIDDLRPDEIAITKTSRLLIRTGVWPKTDTFPSWIPVIAAGVADWLKQKKVVLIGLDIPSVDPLDAKVLSNHHALARGGISILESLDLHSVDPGIYQLAAFPLRISGGDGAPVRAVLWRD